MLVIFSNRASLKSHVHGELAVFREFPDRCLDRREIRSRERADKTRG